MSVDLFVLCVACLTVFLNCLVKQFAICLGVFVILLLNVMELCVVGDVLSDRPCMVFHRMGVACTSGNCDMFSVVNVYLDFLRFCVVYIDGRRYVCCSKYNVVSNECNEPTSCLVKLCTFGVFAFGMSLVS